MYIGTYIHMAAGPILTTAVAPGVNSDRYVQDMPYVMASYIQTNGENESRGGRESRALVLPWGVNKT